MDKNTITGLVLMGLVLFGFMWCNKPSEAQLAEQQRIQDSIAAADLAAAKQTAPDSAAVTVLTADEVAQIKQVLTNDTVAGIDRDGVKLSLVNGEVAGTIALDGKNIDFADVLKNDSTVKDVALHNRAVSAVKNAFSDVAKSGPFAKFLSGTDQTVVLKNDSVNITINAKGGVISSAKLNGYKQFNKNYVEVFTPGENQYSFVLTDGKKRYDTKDFYFTPVEKTDTSVLMQLDLGGGSKWGLRYTIEKQGSYMVRMEMVQQGMNEVIPLNINSVDLSWKQKMARHEEGKMFEERNSAIYYKFLGEDGDVEYTSENGNDEKQLKDRLKWISTKNQYFSAVLIADSCFTGAQLVSNAITDESPEYAGYLKNLSIQTTVPYSSDKANPASFYFYLGPNRYATLSDYDKYSPKEELQLTRLVPLGWKLFRWINTGIIIPLFNFLGGFIGSYGIIILLLTIIIKLILSPLTYKSYISQAKMRILAPDIAEINEKYPGQENALKRQQKTMELYKKAGANPMGGCLPMLLQMPILIAMFTFFPSCIELRGESFLWAADLSAPDKIVEWTAQIPIISSFFGNHISLFCMLMTVTNIVYTYLSMQSQKSQTMPGMKWMMYLMPLMFLCFFNNYASGLSYYYFISLLITIAQTYSCRLFVKEDKVRARMAAYTAKPRKKSGFMARLEAAQKQQQQALREKQKRSGKQRK